MADRHVVRLARGMLAFYDPINHLHLMYPGKTEGSLPLDANLEYVVKAVKSGRIIDVSGTILSVDNKPVQSQSAAETAEAKSDARPVDSSLVEEGQSGQDEKQEKVKQANKARK